MSIGLATRRSLSATAEDVAVRRTAELLVAGVRHGGWSIPLLCAAHLYLMRDARGDDRFPGRVRWAECWIGPSRDAAEFVPPWGQELRSRLESLVRDLNASAPSPRQASEVLGRLVLIHPFNDGNGRLSRAAALAVLELSGASYDIPLNRQLRETRPDYLHALGSLHANDDWESWFGFFLHSIEGARQR